MDVDHDIAALVRQIRADCPELSWQDATALAIASIQVAMFDDTIVVLGDIADALNDIRHHVVPPARSVH